MPLVTPAEVKELVPFIDESVILGGFYTPSVAVVDSLRAGTIMRERAQEVGRAAVFANTEVLGIDVEHGRVERVRTTRGDVEAEIVVIACGVWSPRIARMAGASIPLTPAVHQMIDVGPVPRFLASKSAIEFPIVRDMDTNMYERQDGQGLEVGSYAHRPILHEPDEIPSIEEAALSPTELPFTQEDFELQLEHALELVPEILGDESVGIKYAINGLLSLTPDGLPLLGETPEVKGLWSAAAVWVKEGPGVGRAVAEWMVHGRARDRPPVLRHRALLRRAEDAREREGAAPSEGFNKTYGIVHPREQWASNRDVRASPFYEREQELGAVFYEAAAGSGRTGTSRTRRSSRSSASAARARVGRALVVADHQRRAPRDARARGDVRPDRVLRSSTSSAPARSTSCRRCRARQMNVPYGRVIYTPVLTPSGGFKSDLTIMKMDDEHVPRRHRRRARHGGQEVVRRPSADGRLGADRGSHVDVVARSGSGGRARATSSRRSRATTSRTRRFPFATWKDVDVDGVEVLASRISYVGDLGWELYVPMEQGAKLWDAVWEAGQPHGVVPAGIGVYGTTGRLEKAYRAFGAELDADYDVVEAGHGVVEGEGRGLRRQGGARRAIARPTRPRCSAR